MKPRAGSSLRETRIEAVTCRHGDCSAIRKGLQMCSTPPASLGFRSNDGRPRIHLLRAKSLLFIWALWLVSSHGLLYAQVESKIQPQFPPKALGEIVRIEASRTVGPIKVDGKLDEVSWRHAHRSPRFVDLIHGQQTIHDTRVSVLWNDEFLYLGYWIEEPFVQAKFTERDAPIYYDNDVEFFVAGADAYYEFEINAHGTVYEGLFIWQDNFESSGFAKLPEFDQTKSQTKFQPFNGVGLKNHPRGQRWAYLKWDFPGAQFAVQIDGTLNDSSDRDRGWTVELAFPWKGMKSFMLGDQRALPPRPGDVWRMDFSRFNQYREAVPAKDSGGWALSSHGVWDSHIPEVFPFVTFSANPSSATSK